MLAGPEQDMVRTIRNQYPALAFDRGLRTRSRTVSPTCKRLQEYLNGMIAPWGNWRERLHNPSRLCIERMRALSTLSHRVVSHRD